MIFGGFFWESVFCLWISSYINFFEREEMCVYNGKGLDGVFTLSEKLFFLFVLLGRLAYVQYRVIELFPIGVVGLVFFTVPLIKVFVFWVDWRNCVIKLPRWRCRVSSLPIYQKWRFS